MVSTGKTPEEINVENVLTQAQIVMEDVKNHLIYGCPPPYIIEKCRASMNVIRTLGLCTDSQDMEIGALMESAEDRYRERVQTIINSM